MQINYLIQLILLFQLHKAWLARRSKSRLYQLPSSSNDTALNRITYLRKLIKFNKNTNEPMSENDVSYVPHDLNKELEVDRRTNLIVTSSTEDTNQGMRVISSEEDLSNAIESNTFEVTSPWTLSTSSNPEEKFLNSSGLIDSFTEREIKNYKKEESIGLSSTTSSTELSPVATITPEITTLSKFEKSQDTTSESPIKADDITIKSVFTSWSTWSSCSRSCGGGVKTQSRKCVKRT